MAEETKSVSKRTKAGKFAKGKSGNPKGRPKGSKNKTTEIKEAIEAGMVESIEKDAQDILRTTIDLAKAGDTTCIKILMDRMWPAGRQEKSKGDGAKGGVNIIIKGLEIEAPKVIEGEVLDAESN